MKNFFFTLLFTLVITACLAQSKNTDLVGKWVVYHAEVKAPGLDEATLEAVVNVVKTYTYQFNKNNTLLYEDFIIKKAKGTWTLQGEKLHYSYTFEVPKMVNESGKEHTSVTMKVILIEKNKMVWEEEPEPGKVVKYFLEKQ